MPHKGLKRRNAKKDQVTKYIQMGMFIIDGHFELIKKSVLEFTIHWLGKYSQFKKFRVVQGAYNCSDNYG